MADSTRAMKCADARERQQRPLGFPEARRLDLLSLADDRDAVSREDKAAAAALSCDEVLPKGSW